MFEPLLTDLAELSVPAWLLLMLCAGVIGIFAGACLGGRDDDEH